MLNDETLTHSKVWPLFGRERGSRHGSAVLETLAQESYDMITLLPTYIENTRAAILTLGNDTSAKFREVESLLMDDSESGSAESGRKSLKQALHAAEKNILKASTELKEIVVESGNMAESLFERVDTGYKELEVDAICLNLSCGSKYIEFGSGSGSRSGSGSKVMLSILKGKIKL